MKIIVASTINPFVDGGSTFIVDWLEENLRRAGHQVEALNFPFDFSHTGMLDQMLALRLLDLSQEPGGLPLLVSGATHLFEKPLLLAFIGCHDSIPSMIQPLFSGARMPMGVTSASADRTKSLGTRNRR